MLALLSIPVALANLGCLIFVLTKLFPAEGVGKGIFGIICGIYTFVWGWQNKDKYDLDTVMKAWTACVVLNVVINMIARGQSN